MTNVLTVLRQLVFIGITLPSKDEGMGSPVRGLVEEALSRGLRPTAAAMEGRPSHGAFRLNLAGLKLFWRTDRGGNTVFFIGGDQERYYPEFVQAARDYLQREGLWGN
jgi:hypothetical protein